MKLYQLLLSCTQQDGWIKKKGGGDNKKEKKGLSSLSAPSSEIMRVLNGFLCVIVFVSHKPSRDRQISHTIFFLLPAAVANERRRMGVVETGDLCPVHANTRVTPVSRAHSRERESGVWHGTEPHSHEPPTDGPWPPGCLATDARLWRPKKERSTTASRQQDDAVFLLSGETSVARFTHCHTKTPPPILY